jgi:cytochrome c-type biogenesis protein CcmH/NrfG
MLQYTYFEPSAAKAEGGAEATEVQRLIAEGDETDALKLLSKDVFGAHATAGSGWVLLGGHILKLRKAQYAERSFEHALELDARTRDAHAYLGEVALQRGDLGKAEREFQAELLIDANQSFALGGDG